MPEREYNALKGIEVVRKIIVQKPADELYRFWRHLENLPAVLTNAKSITILDEKHSHWSIKRPVGLKFEWISELTEDIPGRWLAWKSVEGSDIRSMGSVEFIPAPDGQGSEMIVTLKYYPPAGRLGALPARVLGKDPSRQIAEGLRDFKKLIETSRSS